MSFTSLGLPASLTNILTEQNITNPYPIQEQVIPAVLNKKDILGIAQTGSGKTISYVLPILMNMQDILVSKNRHVNALLLVPTRELAMQVGEVFKLFRSAFSFSIKTLAVHGGVSINKQMIALQGVKILIATPGRLLDLIKSKAVHLSEIQTLVVDEADKMFNMGFADEIDRILYLLPEKRQNLLFSATLNNDINNINQIILHNPVVIKIEPREVDIELINQLAYNVAEESKGQLLRYIIKTEEYNQVLVFTSSTFRADAVATKLRKNGIDAIAIHGKKSQGARTENLRKFKTGNLQVLVTTDLLSRGIDIEFMPCVINYELPRSPKDYIHRIGRTGRAESPGKAISFVTPDDEHHFKVIQKKMGKLVKMIDAEDIDFNKY